MKIYRNKNTFYAVENGEYVHRKIMNASSGQIIDHINHNGLDNRPGNLRFVTNGQNRQRSLCRPQGKYPFHGITFQAGKWRARIWHKNIFYHLGCFNTPIEAAKSYDRAAKEKFGEYCKTNF